MNKNCVLEIVVFLVGASIMVYELVGSRILAPYLGTSLFIWTGIIGVILGALSIGYWRGGILADKHPEKKYLARILVIAAFIIFLTIFIKDIFLFFLTENIDSLRLGAALSSLVLFAPASVFLGMVAPYAARLKMDQLKTSGATVGRLYSLSTIGSIVGTFFAGFFLIPFLGSTKILFLVAIMLLFCAFLLNPFPKIKNLMVAITLFGASAIGAYAWDESFFLPGVTHYETQYAHVRVYEYTDKNTQQKAQIMRTNNEASSSMFLNSDDLVFDYTKFYDLAEHFSPNFQSTLMLGGAAYSYPKYFVKNYPNATIDVVEIDPKLTEIAREHFRLEDHPNMNIFHEDGRTFLRKNEKKYDIFYGDAYKSLYSLPYHLTTIEAVQGVYDALNDDGVALVNIISQLEGDGSEFLRSEYATFANIFPQVFLFAVDSPEDGSEIQNVMLVASKNKVPFVMQNNDPHIQNFLDNVWMKNIEKMDILTDDYAPVEYLIEKMM